MTAKTNILTGLLTAVMVLAPYVAEAQLNIWPHLKEIELQFSDETEERIKEIYLQKQYGDALVSGFADAEIKEALDDAWSEIFSASGSLFNIYVEHCIKLRDGFTGGLPAEFKRIEELERNARLNMERSQLLKSEAQKSENTIRAGKFYRMAFDLEAIALLNKARALRLYQDFPVIYEYEWDNDFTVLNDEPVRATGVVEKTEPETETGGTIESADIKQGISFIIQIAAHSAELPDQELRRIYSGNRETGMIFEDNWYKYYIGPFPTYEEAEKVFEELDNRNMFIAAYRDGQRISVTQARRSLQQQ